VKTLKGGRGEWSSRGAKGASSHTCNQAMMDGKNEEPSNQGEKEEKERITQANRESNVTQVLFWESWFVGGPLTT